MIDLENLNECLKTNVIEITFEKVDGSTRTMRATLKTELLPPAVPAKPGKERAQNPDVMAVYSLDDQGWRSFRRVLFIKAEML